MNYKPLSISLGVAGVAMALCCAVGCSDRPALGTVTGIVTLNGKPLAEAVVAFDPGDAPGSRGTTDANGKYELIYLGDESGARVGHHKVRIFGKRKEFQPDNLLAERYNKETILTADVQRGPNIFDFELTSSP